MSNFISGVGYNSQTRHKTTKDGRATKPYNIWCNMIQRCYNPKTQLKHPTYKGCTVAEEWHDFQNFADWYYSHDYSGIGYQLDKDILNPGNKVYSPETCCFIPQQINLLLVDRAAARGKYPQGVYIHERDGNYCAQMSVDGKRKHLGCSESPRGAYVIYRKAKESYVRAKAKEFKDRIAEDVFIALITWQLI